MGTSPPITSATIERLYEFVLVESPALARVSPTPNIFSKYFTDLSTVTHFTNLGGDSLLIVPTPDTSDSNYAHLACFVRRAVQQQQRLLWATISQMLSQRLNDQPCWVSTSGLGVYWLHIRLDTRPKYYVHQPYRHIIE